MSEKHNTNETTRSQRRSSLNRRRFVKSVGAVGGVGVLGIGAARGSSSTSQFDTSFSSTDREEVAEFVDETFQWSENKSNNTVSTTEARQSITDQRDRVIEDLSDKQLNAVGSMVQGLELSFESSQGNKDLSNTSDGVVSAQACNNYRDNIKAYVKSPVVGKKFLAFNFVHKVHWCVSRNKVINVVPSINGNAKSYIAVNWDYRGLAAKNLKFHPKKYYAIAYRKGKYRRCVIAKSGPSCVATDYGAIKEAVYNDRSGRTISKSIDT